MPARSRRRSNWTDPDEAAQYALTRWGHDHYVATKGRDRTQTWPQFAAFIRETGDPGAEEVASSIEGIEGYTHDYPVRVYPLAHGSHAFIRSLTPARSLPNKRMTNPEIKKLRDRLSNIELSQLPVGSELMLSTADRKHPFRGKVRRITPYQISFETAGTTVDLILRKNGSVSHVVRYPQRAQAFPQTTQLRWWKLAE